MNNRCVLKTLCNHPGMVTYLFQGIFPVKMLTAGDKPDFKFFQIDHGISLYTEPRIHGSNTDT